MSQRSNGPTRPSRAQTARQETGQGCLACQDGTDQQEQEVEDPQPIGDQEDEEDDDNQVNIDDGLLDEVFEDLPGNDRAKSQPVPRNTKVTRMMMTVT